MTAQARRSPKPQARGCVRQKGNGAKRTPLQFFCGAVQKQNLVLSRDTRYATASARPAKRRRIFFAFCFLSFASRALWRGFTKALRFLRYGKIAGFGRYLRRRAGFLGNNKLRGKVGGFSPFLFTKAGRLC